MIPFQLQQTRYLRSQGGGSSGGNGGGGISNITIVDNISERDMLNTTLYQHVIVKDATGDPTVTTGSAEYYFNVISNTWNKISEKESLDLISSTPSGEVLINNVPIPTHLESESW